MEVVNYTPWFVHFEMADLLRDELFGVVIVKSTFDVGTDGRLRGSIEPSPLVSQLEQTPFGWIHGEGYFRKRGADLCILATYRQPRAVARARVRLALGTRTNELHLTGPRYWIRGPRGLVPSAPEPFAELAVGYEYAFGGATTVCGHPTPYRDNPIGRGYHLEESVAQGQPLPCIEDGAALPMERFDQAVPVAGWGPYPSFWGLRATANVTIGEDGQLARVDPGLFNHAHPSLVLAKLEPGMPLTIDGLVDRRVGFTVPAPPTRVTLEQGGEQAVIPAAVDGVFYWVDQNKLCVTQRARFRYRFVPHQVRRVIVEPASM